ncbi:CENP-X/MHF2 family protein [Aspergillus foveolatus]|uniref:CENP-X/MHF2 family protein n=1 Tax=Aspergillus foveolatus TaxID=210207 RepID=UPI003CCE21F0
MPVERQAPQKRRTLPFKPPSRASGSAVSALTAGPSKATKPTKTKNTNTATTFFSNNKPARATTSRRRPSPSPSPTNSGTDSASSASDDSSRASPASASDDESEANYILAEITHAKPEHEDVLSSDPLIPPKLLTRLLHHHFRSEKTKIAKDANAVVAKYIDVFVREAVARAAFERAEAQGVAGGGGGIADGFLEVEDLEKMGPQLAMDF